MALSPACTQSALSINEDDHGRVTLACSGGCEQVAVLSALTEVRAELNAIVSCVGAQERADQGA